MTGSIVLLMNVCFESFLPTSYPVICCDCHCVYCEAPADEAGVSSPIAQFWVTALSSQLKVRGAPQKCCRPAVGSHSPCSEPSLQTRHRLFCTSGPRLNLELSWDTNTFVCSNFKSKTGRRTETVAHYNHDTHAARSRYLFFLSENQHAGAYHEGFSAGQSYQQGARAYALAVWS